MIVLGTAALLLVLWFFIFVKNFKWLSSLGITGIFVLFGGIILLGLIKNFADRVEKKGDKFYRGAKGEDAIYFELKKLEDEVNIKREEKNN